MTKSKKSKISLKYYMEEKYKNDVIVPDIAYNGTSACFDLYAVETTVIKAREASFVPIGIRFIIPKGYYVKVANRSGNGIKKNLNVFPGIFDPGYTGEWKIKVYNLGNEDQVLEKGKGVCQVEVLEIPPIEVSQASEEEWDEYCKQSIRKDKGFGSSDSSK